MTEFSQKLRALRKAAGLRQEEAAAATGMSGPDWSGLETGKRKNPTLNTVLRISSVLGVRPGDLIDDDPRLIPVPDPTELPLVGYVGASASFAGEAVDEEAVGPIKGRCRMRVVDDSMEDVVRDGQTVMVDTDAKIRSGDLVVVDPDGDGWILKKYLRSGKLHHFVSLNIGRDIPPVVKRSRPKRMYKVTGVLYDRREDQV